MIIFDAAFLLRRRGGVSEGATVASSSSSSLATTTLRTLRPELVLLCGLSPMTETVERDLIASGVPAQAIRVEAYDG